MKLPTASALIAAALFTGPIHAVRRGRAGQRYAEAHPIEKVVVMLQGLMAKVEEEAKDEAVTYTKFEYWCKNSEKTLDSAIASSNQEIETLTAGINGRLQEEGLLGDQIDDLQEEMDELDAADKKAKDVRKEMADLYTTTDKNFKDTIKAINEAIELLEKSFKETDNLLLAQQKVGELLVLVQPEATSEQLTVMQAFLRDGKNKTRPVLKAKGDQAKHVKKYAFKSGSVIEILKQLSLKFQDESLAATKAETNSINAYELAVDARKNSFDTALASSKQKKKAKKDAEEDRVRMEGERDDAEADLKDDTNNLKATKKACAVKQAEWSERSDTRKLELEAMKMGIKILAKVGGVRTEAPSNPVPPPSPLGTASLLEVSTDPRVKAVQLLRASAAATHSHSLERMAQEISAAKGGHFDQVINMIQKMIFRLMDEQRDEDNHKHWCDEELNKTEVSIENKKDKLDALDLKIKEAEAQVARLADEIKLTEDFVAKLDEHIAEATEIRKIGKKENELSAKDARDAQKALSNAISVLESFYKESGMVPKKDWELLQQPVTLPKTPSTWDSGYTGVADPVAKQPDGIITVLKSVSADFAKMEADTMSQEETDQGLFDEDMKSCKIEKARRERQSQEFGAEKKRQTDKVASLQSSSKTVAGQKESVEQYLKDLQHACVDGDSTYEDRKAARAKEIDALKQAQGTLAGAFTNTTNTTKLIALRR